MNEMVIGVGAMGGVNGIKEQILEDAHANAERIIEEAEDRARVLKEKKAQEAGNLKKRLTEENNLKAQERKRRMLTAAQLDMRKDTLAVKQKMIDKVLKEALEAINRMPLEEYHQIVSDMLVESVMTGEEQVVFSSKDRDRLSEEFLTGVNNRLKEQGRKGELKLAPERGAFDSGFVLLSGGMEINNSFESIIRMSRDDMESQIAEILFGEEG